MDSPLRERIADWSRNVLDDSQDQLSGIDDHGPQLQDYAHLPRQVETVERPKTARDKDIRTLTEKYEYTPETREPPPPRPARPHPNQETQATSPSVVRLLKVGLNDRKLTRRHLKAIRNRSPTPPPPVDLDQNDPAEGSESNQSVRGHQTKIKISTRSQGKRREPWETFRPSHVSIGAAGRLTELPPKRAKASKGLFAKGVSSDSVGPSDKYQHAPSEQGDWRDTWKKQSSSQEKRASTADKGKPVGLGALRETQRGPPPTQHKRTTGANSSPRRSVRQANHEIDPNMPRDPYYSPSWPTIIPSGSSRSNRQVVSEPFAKRRKPNSPAKPSASSESRRHRVLAELPPSDPPYMMSDPHSSLRQSQSSIQAGYPAREAIGWSRIPLQPGQEILHHTAPASRHRVMGPPPLPARQAPNNTLRYPSQDSRRTSLLSSDMLGPQAFQTFQDPHDSSIDNEDLGELPAPASQQALHDAAMSFRFDPPVTSYSVHPQSDPYADEILLDCTFDQSLTGPSASRFMSPVFAPSRPQKDLDQVMSQIEREIPLDQRDNESVPRWPMPSQHQDELYFTPRRQLGTFSPREGQYDAISTHSTSPLDYGQTHQSAPAFSTPQPRAFLPRAFQTPRQRTPINQTPRQTYWRREHPWDLNPQYPSIQLERHNLSPPNTSLADWERRWAEG